MRGFKTRPAAVERGRSQRQLRSAQDGYTLAALMIMIMVMSITMAVAVPSWTNWVQRDNEAEAIFRGMQYAEAIRVFQQRHGRPPTTLEELVKVEPRSIRQLYPNPLNESGKWGLLMRQAGGGRAGAANNANTNRNNGDSGGVNVGAGGASVNREGRVTRTRGRNRTGPVVAIPPAKDGEENPSGGRLSLGEPVQRTAGPLVGVYPGVSGQSLRTFNGSTSYDAWRFQVDLIPAPVIIGGDGAAPRVTSEWIGKPFRSDLQPQNQPGGPNSRGINQGSAPKGGFSPGSDAKAFRPGSSRREGKS